MKVRKRIDVSDVGAKEIVGLLAAAAVIDYLLLGTFRFICIGMLHSPGMMYERSIDWWWGMFVHHFAK